jgi:hypothetical protein
MSIYEPISRFLARAKQRSISLTFDQIEGILRRPLPRSAYTHSAWWSNNTEGHSHARSWVEAGWRTENVDLKAQSIVFSRAVPRSRKDIPDPFGAMRGSVVFVPGVDLTQPTGEVWKAAQDDEE